MINTPLLVGSRALAFSDKHFYRPCDDIELYLNEENFQPHEWPHAPKHTTSPSNTQSNTHSYWINKGFLLELSLIVKTQTSLGKVCLWNFAQASLPLVKASQVSMDTYILSWNYIRVLPIEIIYAVKRQQIGYDLHWQKTMEDVWYLEHVWKCTRPLVLKRYKVANVQFFPYLSKPSCKEKCIVFDMTKNRVQRLKNWFDTVGKQSTSQSEYFDHVRHLFLCHANPWKRKWILKHYYQIKWKTSPPEGNQDRVQTDHWQASWEIDCALFLRLALEPIVIMSLIHLTQEYILDVELQERVRCWRSGSSDARLGNSSSSSSSSSDILLCL
jgi:hypothetical protein